MLLIKQLRSIFLSFSLLSLFFIYFQPYLQLMSIEKSYYLPEKTSDFNFYNHWHIDTPIIQYNDEYFNNNSSLSFSFGVKTLLGYK